MKRIVLFLTVLMGLAISANSQHYLKSAGFRLGHTTGISFQKFVAKHQAVDLMVSGRHNGLQFNTLYKWHSPTEFNMEGNFVLYYGLGGHFGFERLIPYNLEFQQPFPEYDLKRKSYFTMGVDVVVGIEYRMMIAPITLSFDVKPYFNYIGFKELNGHFWDSALSIKYVFNQ